MSFDFDVNLLQPESEVLFAIFSIDEFEFQKCLQDLGSSYTKRQSSTLLKILDENDDGVLQYGKLK